MAGSHRPVKAAYVVSQAAHGADNRAGRNHWSVYTREIADQLGLSAEAVQAGDLTAEVLAGITTLILPAPAGDWLGEAGLEMVADWVDDGGLLIAFGAEGLEEVCGVTGSGETMAQADDFCAAAGMAWAEHELTAGVIWPLHPEAAVPILAPVSVCMEDGAEVLAEVLGLDGEETGRPAICYREVQAGACLWFAFDVAKHMWVAHHGRPVDGDHDGDGYYRLSDAIPAREFEAEVPYADQILFLLRAVIGRQGHPMISAMPPIPETGEPADMLLHWGGDGEAAEGTQVPASDFMAEQGLPYHLNLMPDKEGRFVVSKEQFEHIKANGHECSVHYDFQSGYEHPYAFTEEEVLQQARWYEEAFGETAACSVFHWTHWIGWSEPAEWMLKAGGCGDNSRIHRGSPPLNPVNMIGYSFGTSLPYHFYRDHRGGNERLEFVSEPIVMYECGYFGAEDRTDFGPLHNGLKMTLRFHLTADMFFHPVNVARYESCREAVRETLRWLDERGVNVRHMGNDELAFWWLARSKAQLWDMTATVDSSEFTVACPWADGCVVEVPARGEGYRVESPSGELKSVLRDEPWGRWLWIACPKGETAVRVIWE